MWGHSGGRRHRPEHGTMPVGSEKRRPTQQVEAQIGKQEAVGRDPSGGLQHVQRAADEVRGGRRRGQRRQRCTQCRGLPLESANPELARWYGMANSPAAIAAAASVPLTSRRATKNNEITVIPKRI